MASSFADHTKKKTISYKERCEENRIEFRDRLKHINPGTLVYIDEAGIDNRLYREHGRAPRGQKVYVQVCGKKRERVSVIGALLGKEFIAPFTFQGGCNANVFNTWLDKVLMPTIPKGSTLVMDNAAFHKSVQTKEIIENAGCSLLFLPPYSPDLNPIEHWWHKIKSILRPIVQTQSTNIHDTLNQCLLNI